MLMTTKAGQRNGSIACRLLAAARRRHRLRGDESGFTLIELLIVLVIMPIVIGGVTVAIISTLQDQQGLQTRLSDSSDSVISSAFFPRDAQSAADVTTNASATSPSPCSTSAAGMTGAT
ncbi:MAG: type II secretion system protein, partial [Acidimicrobiales bacterium]